MPDASVDPIICETFSDAAGLALGLHEHFGAHHAVLLLDDDGSSVDLQVFTGDEHRISHAVCVAMALVSWLPEIASVVLFSEVDLIQELHEDDVRLWHTLVRSFDDHDVELLDWLQTDCEHVRSLTISCDFEPTWERREPGLDLGASGFPP